MHCLVLTGDFPNRLDPWRGPYHRRQAECLAKHCRVTVIEPLSWTRLLSDLRLRKIIDESDGVLPGVDVYHPLFWYMPKLWRMRHWRGVLAAARRVIAKMPDQQFDLVLATFAYPHGLAARHLASDMGVPYIVKVRGTDLHGLPDRGWRPTHCALALQGAAAVIAVSSNLADIAERLGVDRKSVHLLPNGVDRDRFPILSQKEARSRVGAATDRRILLFVGRLHHVKGIDVLIGALEALKGSSGTREVTAVFAGDGPMRGWIERETARRGLSDSVQLLGHVSRENVALWMNAADVLVLPSRNEGCPNVVLEALCCGTPVVASNVGAVPDLIDESCGLIVPPENATQLGEALTIAFEKKWDRLTIRQHVEGMSWENNARKLHEILAQLVHRNAGLVRSNT